MIRITDLSENLRDPCFWKSKMSLSRLLLSLAFYFSIATFLTTFGCGKKGPPLPPDTLVPEAVAGLYAEGRPGGLLISWFLPEENSDGSGLVDLAGFKLYKRKDNEKCPDCPSYFPEYFEIDLELREGYYLKGKSFYFMDGLVDDGGSYSYKVAPFNKSGYFGDFSDVLDAEFRSPPKAPAGLEASPGDMTVRLRWPPFPLRYEDAYFAGYRVYRTLQKGDYQDAPLNRAPLLEEHFTDIGVKNNSNYYYVVRVLIKSGETYIEGASSEEVSATPVDMLPPPVPSGVTLVPTATGVAISWIRLEGGGPVAYNVYRRRKGELAMEKINASPLEENHFFDKNVEKGASYIYAVSSIDDSPRRNESLLSDEVHVRIP